MKKILAFLIGLIAILVCNTSVFAAYYDDAVNDGSSWEKAYILNNAEDFVEMLNRINDRIETKEKYYQLNADTDITASEIEPVYFIGHLNGKDHTIKLSVCPFSYITVSNDEIAVRNLNITGTVKTKAALAGTLSSGIIEKCSFNGTIATEESTNNDFIGGLISFMINGTIKDCTVNANIDGAYSNSVGGIVGSINDSFKSSSTIDNCTVTQGSTITSKQSFCGGIVGYISYTSSTNTAIIIKNCNIAEGVTITSLVAAGGIIGSVLKYATVQNCTSNAVLSATYKGGIIGYGDYATTSLTLSGNKWSGSYPEVGGINSDTTQTQPTVPNIEDNTEVNVLKSLPVVTWNGHRYQLYNENLTWEEAKTRCEALGGHLLTITSQAEQTFVESMLKDAQTNYFGFWLGAKANESGWWEWVTEEVFEKQYENFADNQPDGSGNYLHIYGNAPDEYKYYYTLGKWDDTQADGSNSGVLSKHGFICEWDKDDSTVQSEIKAADLSSKFEQWQKNPDAWKNENSEVPSSVIPNPEDTSHLTTNPAKVETGTLPTSYDSRVTHGLPPVRNQGAYNTCWSFASIGAMEADYMAQKMTSLGEIPNLSELHLAWFVYKDPSIDNKILYSDMCILDQAGTSDMAVNFLENVKKSPINENDMPYTTAGTDKTKSDNAIETFLKNKTFTSIPVSLKDNNNFGYIEDKNVNNIKKAIMEHGAVFSSYSNVDAGYNDAKTSYYYPGTTANMLGHAVLLVGWDDNYAVDNFKTQPKKKGAWLVRNSLGEIWGAKGYFWMSYAQADTNDGISDVRAFIIREDEIKKESSSPNPQSSEKTLEVKGYDEKGKTKSITPQYAANIFQSERNESIVRIGFYTTDNNAKYEVFINNFGKLKPTDPGEAETPLLSGTIPYAGYHTIDLDKAIDLYSGDYYSVIVKITLESSYQYPTAVETSIDKYAIAIVNKGESYFAKGDPVPSIWIDGHDVNSGPFNACIKVFTLGRTSNETQPEIITSALIDAAVGEEYNFTLSATGSETIEWRSGNIPAGLALSRRGILSGKPQESGEFNVNLTAFNNAGVTETTLNLTVKEGSGSTSLGGSGGGCSFNLGVYCGVFALALFIKMRHKK